MLSATLFSILILATIGCLRFRKASFLASRWFGVIVLVVGWVGAYTSIVPVQATVFAFRALFLCFVTGALIYQVAISKEVTLSIIVGAIDGYLLLGIIGAVTLAFAEYVSPHSIRGPEALTGMENSMYLSFITLATVGYGDYTPGTNAVRMICIFLALSGPLYLTILIALLVGKLSSVK